MSLVASGKGKRVQIEALLRESHAAQIIMFYGYNYIRPAIKLYTFIWLTRRELYAVS
jgi:hypothetical protein